jgi:glycerate-2-kinase
MTHDALQIVCSAIHAVDPYTAIRSSLQRKVDVLQIRRSIGKQDENDIDLKDYDEIVLVAFGKASSAMATATLEQIMSISEGNSSAENENPAQDASAIPCTGVVICKDNHATKQETEILQSYNIELFEASHPVPDQRSADAAKRLLQVVSSHASPKTLVVCCISGGGSALFCQPTPPLTLQNLQDVNAVLLGSGMGIQEMNVIRKRLDEGKGGRLARACHPSHVLTLVLSDVLGDPLDLIASGPTVPDTSTWQDAWDIVEQYNLQKQLPAPVMEILEKGQRKELEDSPSASHAVFQHAQTVLVGNNAVAVQAAAEQAQSLGYYPVVLGTEIKGEAQEIAHMYTAMARHLQQTATTTNTLPPYSMAPALPVALIAGGETTVSLTNDSGKGGRNQELALAAGLQLQATGIRNVVLASVGTDGGDGPTDAAGAVVDGTTFQNTRAEALLSLSKHDAYHYLQSLGEKMNVSKDLIVPLIKTGPTGTNVADICVTLIESADKEP